MRVNINLKLPAKVSVQVGLKPDVLTSRPHEFLSG
jgi:hypothetical protein